MIARLFAEEWDREKSWCFGSRGVSIDYRQLYLVVMGRRLSSSELYLCLTGTSSLELIHR